MDARAPDGRTTHSIDTTASTLDAFDWAEGLWLEVTDEIVVGLVPGHWQQVLRPKAFESTLHLLTKFELAHLPCAHLCAVTARRKDLLF